MEVGSSPFQKHVFVCLNARENGACCAERDSEAVFGALKQYVKTHRLQSIVRVNRAGCMDQCSQGPNVLIYPDNVWYRGVAADDVETIIREHLEPLRTTGG